MPQKIIKKNTAVQSEKRIYERKKDNTLSISADITYPKNITIVKPIEEISEKGLSFRTFDFEGYFEEGFIIKNLKIFNHEQETIIPKSKVVYAKSYHSKGAQEYRIGICFLEYKQDFAKRSKRTNLVGDNNVKVKVAFRLDAEEFRAQLVNFSKYGLCLSVANPRFMAQKSDNVKDITIKINDKLVYSANGVIVNLKRSNAALEIGVSLKEKSVPVDHILDMVIKDKANFSYDSFNKNLYLQDIVSKEFKESMQEFYYFLVNLEHNLNQFEASIKKESLEIKEKLCDEMMDVVEKNVFPKFDEQMKYLNDFMEKVSKEDFDSYKIYYQRLFHRFFLKSPFMHRVYHKPLGYAGDFEMMNMIYANKPKGNTLFAKIMDKYYLSISPSQANRNRIPYITKKIIKYASVYLKNNRRFKVTSIACGPCLEIQRLLETEKISNYIDFTLVDVDKGALENAKNRLIALKEKYKRKTTFKFINESVYPLMKNKKVRDSITDGQHFIYSLGLFEYLSDVAAKRLIKVLFDKLRNGGILVIGNYSTGNFYKAGMDMIGEWFLAYRCPKKCCFL